MAQSRPACTVVVADFGDCENLEVLANLSKEHSCSVLVYAKNSEKICNSRGKWETVTKPNLGREQGTYADYVVEHYNNLPDKIIFTPASLQKHDRLNRFKTLLASERPRVPTHLPIRDHPPCWMKRGNSNPLLRWKYRAKRGGPLSQWYNKFVGDFESDRMHRTCFTGMLATTREHIHAIRCSTIKIWQIRSMCRPIRRWGTHGTSMGSSLRRQARTSRAVVVQVSVHPRHLFPPTGCGVLV